MLVCRESESISDRLLWLISFEVSALLDEKTQTLGSADM